MLIIQGLTLCKINALATFALENQCSDYIVMDNGHRKVALLETPFFDTKAWYRAMVSCAGPGFEG